MTYREALQYLANLGREYMDMRLGLAPVSELLGRLGDPQNEYPSVVIAGTNGKGSIAAVTSSILSAAGFRCGLFTSPHLVDIRERIQVNGVMISRKDMLNCVEAVKGRQIRHVTYFEFLTAAAFLHFFEAKVDIAVLEVGLGGRLDATNCVIPAVSVISNVALEHTQFLGDTLEKIAWEKAGIIKQDGVCITAAKQKKVVDVIKTVCRDRNAALFRVGKEIRTFIHKDKSFSYRGLDSNYPRLTHGLSGRHQVDNMACAVAAVEVLRRKGFPIGKAAILKGMQKVEWPGRMEVIAQSPTIILDVAHNPAGVKVLCDALKEDFSYRRLIVVFGVFKDKSFKAMIKKLAAVADEFILTDAGTDRALDPYKMLPVAERYGKKTAAVVNPSDALRTAIGKASPDDLICVAGSLYLVGKIKKDWPSIRK